MTGAVKPSPDAHCRLCGHACLARRAEGDRGRCGAGTKVGFSAALQHYGEEPPLSGEGEGGSGTIFFTRCVLRCVFCQNWQISQAEAGRDISVEDLADAMLELEARGALNINLVSPTPYAAQIVMALSRAKKEGLTLPIVYNTGGYDSLTTLSLMDGLVDIYLPDAKMAPAPNSDINDPDPQSARLLGAGDYPKINQIALKEMHRQVGPLKVDVRGIAQKGLLIRHLILPDNLARTTEMLPWLSETFGRTMHLSLMAQYRPAHLVKTSPEEFRAYPGLSRHLSIREYDDIIDLALQCGLENAFVQELDSAENYLPDFTKAKVFSH